MSIEAFLEDLKKVSAKGFASGGIVLPHGFSIEAMPKEAKQKEPRKMTPRQQRMKDKREAQKQRRMRNG